MKYSTFVLPVVSMGDARCLITREQGGSASLVESSKESQFELNDVKDRMLDWVVV